MQAAIITGRQAIEAREYPEPELRAGGAIVDVVWCGICGTDVHAFYSGDPYPPGLCGHEWMGRVRDTADDVQNVAPGDRVSVGILPPCGECVSCRAGLGAWCQLAMMSLGGIFLLSGGTFTGLAAGDWWTILCALARAERSDRNLAPRIRKTPRSTPLASTITMHCGWPIATAVSWATASISKTAASVSTTLASTTLISGPFQ